MERISASPGNKYENGERYIFLAISLGLIGGIWVGMFNIILAKMIPIQPKFKMSLLAISPAIAWFAITYYLLGVVIISDVIGMATLFTGLVVFALSIIGVALQIIVPRMLDTILFLTTITILSIGMQLAWLFWMY